MYMCCPSWVILCLFTPSIDCVYVLPVLSYFVFFHAKYWLCICVSRLELFCVFSRQVLIVYICCPFWVICVCSHLVLIVYMCCSSWVILCLFTPSIDCVYMLPILSYFVFVHAKYWLCICVARLELFCACSRLVLIVYMCCPSWVMLYLFTSRIDFVYMLPVFLCSFTPSIDYVYMLPVLSYVVFVHA
jgi:hypothetical protein